MWAIIDINNMFSLYLEHHTGIYLIKRVSKVNNVQVPLLVV